MRLAIIGAGGHAKVVADAARSAGLEVAGFVEEREIVFPILLGLPVVSDIGALEPDAFVAAIGDNAARKDCFDRYIERGLTATTIVHSSAVVTAGVEVGRGTVVFAGVVINIDTAIGDNVIINASASVDHDCSIGSHAHVAPGCLLAGGVRVGDGALLGIGTCVTPGIEIGEWSVCGAGAAVVRDVTARSTVAGVPARPLQGAAS